MIGKHPVCVSGFCFVHRVSFECFLKEKGKEWGNGGFCKMFLKCSADVQLAFPHSRQRGDGERALEKKKKGKER